MKFKNLLNESFYKGIKINPKYSPNNITYVEVFKNPSASEIKETLNAHDSIEYSGIGLRGGITDEKNPNVYIWRIDVLHWDMKSKITYDVGFQVYGKPNKMTMRMDEEEKDTWNKRKYQQEMIKKLKKLFPKVEHIPHT